MLQTGAGPRANEQHHCQVNAEQETREGMSADAAFSLQMDHGGQSPVTARCIPLRPINTERIGAAALRQQEIRNGGESRSAGIKKPPSDFTEEDLASPLRCHFRGRIPLPRKPPCQGLAGWLGL